VPIVRFVEEHNKAFHHFLDLLAKLAFKAERNNTPMIEKTTILIKYVPRSFSATFKVAEVPFTTALVMLEKLWLEKSKVNDGFPIYNKYNVGIARTIAAITAGFL
jgi:hypothetical protein